MATNHEDQHNFNAGITTTTVSTTGDISATGAFVLGEVETVAAAGSAAGDAAAVSAQICYVTASDSTKGVILPDCTIGATLHVINTVAAQTLEVYPPTDGAINGGSTDAAVTLAAKEYGIFTKVAADTWLGGAIPNF